MIYIILFIGSLITAGLVGIFLNVLLSIRKKNDEIINLLHKENQQLRGNNDKKDAVFSKLILHRYITEQTETRYWLDQTKDFVGRIFICHEDKVNKGSITLTMVDEKPFFVTNVHIFTRDGEFTDINKIKKDIKHLRTVRPEIIIEINDQILSYKIDEFYMDIDADIAVAPAPSRLQSKLRLLADPPFAQNKCPCYCLGFTAVGFCQSPAKIINIDELKVKTLALTFSGFSGGPLFFVQNENYYLLGITSRVYFNADSADQETTSTSYCVIFRLIKRFQSYMQLSKKLAII